MKKYDNFKHDFPFFNKNNFVYLDNAATTQKPKSVIAAISNFYQSQNANAGRGISTLSHQAAEKVETVRQKVSNFIKSSNPNSIIFTKNTTESLNLVAFGFAEPVLKKSDEILVSIAEHHANLMPWQAVSAKTGCKLVPINLKPTGEIDLNDLEKKLSKNVKIVAVNHISNILGVENDLVKICQLAHKFGAKVVVDGAQAVGHTQVDLSASNADFYAFSAHKMYGPTGVGVLYVKSDLLDRLNPIIYGGGAIKSVTFENAEFSPAPKKFEAGTLPAAEIIGFGAALDFINEVGLKNIIAHEEKILAKLKLDLLNIPGIKIYGNNQKSLISFNLGDVHMHDVGQILDEQKIAVRAGYLCAMPLLDYIKANGVVRVSLAMYNDLSDVDKFISALKLAAEKFNVK